MNIKSKFIIMFTSFAMVPLLLAGIIIYFVNKDISIKEAGQTLANQEKSIKVSFEQLENLIEKIGSQMSYSRNTIDYSMDANSGKYDINKEAVILNEFKRYQNEYGFYENIALINKDGIGVLDSLDMLKGKDLSNMDYFIRVKENKRIYVSPVKQSITSKKPIFVVAEPILDNSGDFQGIIIQSVDLNRISQQYIANSKVEETGYACIIQGDGTTIVHPKENEILKKNLANTEWGKSIIASKKGLISYNYGGSSNLAAYDYNERLNWIFIVTVPLSEITKSSNAIIKILTPIILVVALICVLTAVLIGKKISRPIEKISNSMNKIADGDFTIKINAKGKDEIANMSHKINNTIFRVKDSLALVKSASVQLGESAAILSTTSQNMVSATNEVSNSIQEIVEDANFQANEISDVVVLLTKLTESIDLVKEKLSLVSSSTKDTEDKAVEGENRIYELIDVIVKIKQSFDIELEKTNNLSNTVAEIGEITDIISNISEQTNLLALNASIEAARAGEQGRGFTVVAEEVRKLAEESKLSSEKIINLVKSITKETKEVTENSSNIGGLLENQAVVANDTIISFEDIIASVKHVPTLILQTEDSFKKAVEDNSMALSKVQKVSKAAQEVSAASEEISASSQELLGSSEEISRLSAKVDEDSDKLKQKINIFKVE